MKYVLLWLTISFWLTSNANEQAPQQRPSLYGSTKNLSCPIEVKPAQSFGPIKIGSSLNDIKSLNLSIKSVGNSSQEYIVGMYSVSLDANEKVKFIGAEIGDLPNCLFFGKLKILKNSKIENLARYFKDCEKPVVAKGGSYIQCKGVSIRYDSWGGGQKTPKLRVENES